MAYVRATGKCLLIMFCLFILGTVLPLLSMIGVAAINRWDGAPGGGIIMGIIWLLSECSALSCGMILCSDIWKGRDNISHGSVKGMMLNCLCFIGATSFGVSALVLLWSGPSDFISKLLSIFTAIAYAFLSLLLLWISAKHNDSERTKLL